MNSGKRPGQGAIVMIVEQTQLLQIDRVRPRTMPWVFKVHDYGFRLGYMHVVLGEVKKKKK